MAYTKTNWVAGVTPLSEANLDNLETQYDELIALFNAHTILMAVADNDPAPLTMGASTILARLAAGNTVAATPAQLMALLSGSAGAEFLLNTQKIGGVVDPTTDQQVATKKYVDDNLTREIYAMAHNTVGEEANMDNRGVIIDAAPDGAIMRMVLPANFSTITAAEIIFNAGATGADMHCDIVTSWGARTGGEAWNVHTETANARDIGATVNAQYLSHSITDLLDVAAPTAGDIIVILISYDATVVATDLWVSGLRLVYT